MSNVNNPVLGQQQQIAQNVHPTWTETAAIDGLIHGVVSTLVNALPPTRSLLQQQQVPANIMHHGHHSSSGSAAAAPTTPVQRQQFQQTLPYMQQISPPSTNSNASAQASPYLTQQLHQMPAVAMVATQPFDAVRSRCFLPLSMHLLQLYNIENLGTMQDVMAPQSRKRLRSSTDTPLVVKPEPSELLGVCSIHTLLLQHPHVTQKASTMAGRQISSSASSSAKIGIRCVMRTSAICK